MISRRRFLQSSLAAALVPMLPDVAVSADLRVRQSWDEFCLGPTYASLLSAIKQMRANKDDTSPASWLFWANVHRYHCPHGKPYFLAWHRGLLFRFEAWLRRVSGDSNLVLPYWNYYANPSIPSEFQDVTSPLYKKNRTGTDVYGALSLDPFADTIDHFQRGQTNAFEPTVEDRPHNPVHNLIGGVMAWVVYSPKDPLFWVHHANIDRLWAAWIKAGNGRTEPAASDDYWVGNLNYGSRLKPVPRLWTIDTTSYLSYQYDDETMPSELPPPPTTSSTMASLTPLATTRPVVREILPLGTSRPLDLDEESTSVQITLTPQDTNRVRSLMLQSSGTSTSTDSNGPVRVVLDGIRVTELGAKGGYFYKVFLNLPEQGVATRMERTYLLGMVGPFEISVAQMQASMRGGDMQHMAADSHAEARLVFPATETLRRIWPTDLERLTVSFVRVNGSQHPAKGRVIHVRAFRVEAEPGT